MSFLFLPMTPCASWGPVEKCGLQHDLNAKAEEMRFGIQGLQFLKNWLDSRVLFLLQIVSCQKPGLHVLFQNRATRDCVIIARAARGLTFLARPLARSFKMLHPLLNS